MFILCTIATRGDIYILKLSNVTQFADQPNLSFNSYSLIGEFCGCSFQLHFNVPTGVRKFPLIYMQVRLCYFV